MLIAMLCETPELVLASTSLYRKRLLERTGLGFRVEDPVCAEEPVPGVTPRALALEFAMEKARSISQRNPRAVVIGSDQLVDLDGEVLGKPGDVETAIAQLRRMAGRPHHLWTAVVVMQGGRSRDHVDLHRLTLRQLADDEIREYVERDQPLDCAGSYMIESLGIALMERIEGDDPTAIEGLPLMATLRLLAEFGIRALAT